MARNILLIEPNYKNKFPPIALMKLSTYHKRLGDNVVFFKGDFRDFVLERISEQCVRKLEEICPSENWNVKQHHIHDYIKTRKTEFLNKMGLENSESKEVTESWLLYYKNFYWKKLYLQEPEWDRVFITTLFTFYFDITVKCINSYKQLVKPEGMIMVGGVLATLQPEELEAATKIKPYTGLLNHVGDLDEGNDMIIDSLPLDYTILEEIDYKYEMSNAYYGATTRGCIRHCKFCAVPKLEPIYQQHIPLKARVDEVRSLCGEQRDLLLMDNNVMASKKFDEVIEDIIASGFGANSTYVEPDMLAIAVQNLKNGINDRGYLRRARTELISYYKSIKNEELSYEVYCALEENHLLRLETTTKEGIYAAYEVVKPSWEKKIKKRRPRIRRVDFNQGVDARLFNPHMAHQFSRIAINPLRIAFDRLDIKDTYIKSIEMCQSEGLKQYSNYLLYNFEDEPLELYRRLEINIKLCERLDVNIYSFPMKYHPLYGEHSHDRNYIGKHWNMKQIRSVQAVLNVTKGCIGRGTSFFYRAFGQNESEFMDILLMPDTMILYRLFFEWLETKKHPLSRYNWQRYMDKLNEQQRKDLGIYLSGDTPKEECLPFIKEMLPFYHNLRDSIQEDKGDLYLLKKQFDAIDKKEKTRILEELANNYHTEKA